jgi:HEAT repeat protein
MSRCIERTLKGLALGIVVAVAAPALRAQVSVDDRVNGLAELVKSKKDDNACTAIDGIGASFASFSEEDKKKAIAAVEKCLNAPRADNDDKLYEAVVKSFANMGELGEKATIRALSSATVSKRKSVLASALRALGFFKNVANIKTIEDMLKNSEPIVVAGAATALANYADQPEKVRRPIVEELVKIYAQYGSAAVNSQQDNKLKGRAKDNLAVVEGPLRDSLKSLTSQEFKDYAAAQKWLNDNKGKKWDPPSKN